MLHSQFVIVKRNEKREIACVMQKLKGHEREREKDASSQTNGTKLMTLDLSSSTARASAYVWLLIASSISSLGD